MILLNTLLDKNILLKFIFFPLTPYLIENSYVCHIFVCCFASVYQMMIINIL